MPLSLPPIVYCGEIADPARWWLVWNDAAPIWAALLAWAALTARHAPRSRPAWAAWALALLLYLSPLCALSATLFSVRVLHHLLLVGAVAPLLALAAGPARAGQRRARSPAAAALVFGLVLWLWHAPQAYAWGLTSVAGYWLMQASLLGTAWWFWRAALRSDQPWGGAVLALFATVAHMGLLGALIVFAGQLLYPVHVAGTLAWGAAPLADQQLGGLLMWVPAIVPFMAAALWRLAQGLRRAEAAA